MKRSQRKVNFFDQWNYSAIPRLLFYYASKFTKVYAIIAGVMLSNLVSPYLTQIPEIIYATYTNDKLAKERREAEEQHEVEVAHIEAMMRIKQAEEAERQKRFRENTRKQEELDAKLIALHEAVSVGDRVRITWFGGEYGNVPPEGNYSIGRVTSIDGLKICGSWGDYEINWEDHPNIITLSSKEYKEELRKLEKQINKKNKKKEVKTWGRLPGCELLDNYEEVVISGIVCKRPK